MYCVHFLDIPAPSWSLADQLGWADNINSPSFEDIVDVACSPLSAESSEALEETCLRSPLSDSGISCSSPISNTEVDELESGAWGSNELEDQIDWSAFQILNEEKQNGQENGTPDGIPFDIPLIPEIEAQMIPGIPEPNAEIIPAPIYTDTQEILSVSNMEIQEIPTVPEVQAEEIQVQSATSAPQKETQELDNSTKLAVQNVTPLSVKNQKIFIVKAVPIRPTPYSKPAKTKAKQRTKEQKERKKNQNRDAALRYRNKKKGELDMLFEEADKLENCNKELTDKVTEITKEIDYLKSLMLDVIKARLSRNKTETSQ